jgi:hypothetical protein
MPANIDELQIEINANATKANQSIDRLVTKLNGLSASLSKLNTSSLTGLANGVNRLGSAMQTMNAVKTSDFTRLANNVQRLGSINVQSLNSAASSMSHLTRAFNNLGSVSANAMQVGELARNISRLGNASVQRAITNIPQLATSLNQLMATLSRAPRVSSNVIQMTQALANLANQGSRVGSASRSMVTGLANTRTAMTRTTKSTFSLASAFGRFYASYFLIIRGLKKLGASIKSTADYFESFNYFNVAFEKIASEWDKDYEKYGYENAESYAKSFTDRMNESFSKMSGVKINTETMTLEETGLKNLGFNIQQITQFASQLASVTNSVGLTGEASLATADSFTKLAGDMSSLFNTDYKTAMTNLQSGLIGQSRALYKYGIDITNATLQTKAYELGLSKAVSEMTQGEKMQLRLLSILEQSKVAWGDQANTINTTSNMIRQLKNNFSEAGMVLGQLFLPLLQKVLPALNGIAIAIKRLLGDIAALFGIQFKKEDFSLGFNDSTETIDGLSDSLDSVTESAKKAKAGLRGFDELKTISVTDSSGAGGGVGGGIDLTDEILKATEEYNKVWQEAYDKMENRAEKFAKKVEKALKPIKKLFKDLSIGDYFAVGEDVSNIVSGINNFFARAIEKVNWQKVGKNIGDFMAGINWTQILSSFGRLFWAGVNGAIDMWKGSFKSAPIETTILSAVVGMSLLASAFSSLASLAGKIVVFFTPLINIFSKLKLAIGGLFAEGGLFGAGGAIATASGPVIALVAALSALVIGLGYVFAKNEEVRQSFFESVDAIMGNLKPALDVITNNVLPELRNGWNRLVSIMKPFADFLNNVFVSIWQDFINPALMYVGETVLPKVISTFSNLWNNVLVPFGQFLGNKLEPRIKILSSILQMLWENVVVPLGNAIGSILATSFENFVDVLNNRVIPVANTVISVFNFMYEKVFSPIITFLVEQMKPKFENTFSTIGGIIDGLSTTLSGLITYITGTFALDWEMAWSGIKDIFKGVMNSVISLFEGIINGIINGLNDFFDGFRNVVSKFGGVIGVDINIPKIPQLELPRFKAGGFPQKYSLFMAGEDGIPEIAGTVGGRTAVAGGVEITGIRDAIYSTSMQEMQLIREQNALLRGILDKEFGISPDAVFRSVKSSASDYTRRTGKPAFN